MKTILCLVLVVLASTAFAQEVTVVGVVDGDTILVTDGSTTREIELVGIDAPEAGQPFAADAMQALDSLLGDKVYLFHEHAVAGRKQVAEVILEGGMAASWAMVEQGRAWCRRDFNRDNPLESFIPRNIIPLCRAEDQARKARLGLWASPRPVAPWAWRIGPGSPAAALTAANVGTTE